MQVQGKRTLFLGLFGPRSRKVDRNITRCIMIQNYLVYRFLLKRTSATYQHFINIRLLQFKALIVTP